MKDINQKNCVCDVRERSRFEGSNDFYSFEEYILNNQNFQEIRPKYEIYSKFWHKSREDIEPRLYEKWYECKECKKIYRLVTPDPPFAGVWKIVDEKEDAAYKND